MYENKIDSEITSKAMDELLRSYLSVLPQFPPRKFISQMTDLEKQNLYQWADHLEQFCLQGMALSEYGHKVIHFHNAQDLQSFEKEGLDILFLQFQADPSLTALWLYEFYCREKDVVQEFDSTNLKGLFKNAYKSSETAEKTHFLKIAIEKNFFVIVALVCMVLSLLLSGVSILCFLLGVGAIMGFFMHFFLAQRIFDEEMVNLCLQNMGGVGEDDIIKSVIISNNIMRKQINQFVPAISI